MAILRWALVGAMAIVAAAALFSAIGGAGGGRRAAGTYHCPMHPQIVQEGPGECPICGMDLVPVAPKAAAPPAGDGGVPGLVPVTLGTERVQRAGVRTAPVRRGPAGGALRAAGVVVASERALHQVAPRAAGFVERLVVAETGRRVAKGELLATIYSPEVLRAQQELLAARRWGGEPGPAGTPGEAAPAHHALVRGLDADARLRLERLGMDPRDVDTLLKSGAPIPALPLRAPAAGYLVGRSAVAGAAVAPGDPLFEIADLSTVWVLADVPEGELGRLRLGQRATFTAPAYPGARFEGSVRFVAPTVDPATRTLRVRLELRNRPGPTGPTLRPGLSGEVTLAAAAGAPALLVPREAIVDTGAEQYVFVARDGGTFEPRRVTLGGRAGADVVVTGGVREGEAVVTTANFLIDSESRLRAALEAQGVAP